jgi:hypothetical protein
MVALDLTIPKSFYNGLLCTLVIERSSFLEFSTHKIKL